MKELATQLESVGSPNVLVFGDVILDRYVWGDAERVSPEAPVVVIRADHDEVRLGGAASVAYLLSGLGVQFTLAGVIGDDADMLLSIHRLRRFRRLRTLVEPCRGYKARSSRIERRSLTIPNVPSAKSALLSDPFLASRANFMRRNGPLRRRLHEKSD